MNLNRRKILARVSRRTIDIFKQKYKRTRKYATRMVQENTKGVGLNGIHQLLVHADYVHLLKQNINIMKKNTKVVKK
jgi:mitochondrial fission protein ELM1